MTTISCYSTQEAANTAANELQNHSIPATTVSEDVPGGVAITTVQVDAEHLEQAIELVHRETLKAEAIVCPDCSSSHVVYPNHPEASPTAAVVEKVAEVR